MIPSLGLRHPFRYARVISRGTTLTFTYGYNRRYLGLRLSFLGDVLQAAKLQKTHSESNKLIRRIFFFLRKLLDVASFIQYLSNTEN